MESQFVLRLTELVMRAFAVASLASILAFAVFSVGMGVGLPHGTPLWVQDVVLATPMGEDRFEPSTLTRSVDTSDQKLLADVGRQLATSMLEPGRVQAPEGEGYLGPRGLSVTTSGTFNVDFLDDRWWTQLAMGTVTALAAVLLAGFCWIVADLVRSAREGSPFTRRNARRLQILGILAALGATLWKVTDHVVNTQLLADTPAAGRFVPVAEWWQVPNYTTIAIGLVLLTLAAIWQRGVALEADVEGLV